MLTVSRISGETICSEMVTVSDDGSVDHLLDLEGAVSPGVYLLTLRDGRKTELARLVVR